MMKHRHPGLVRYKTKKGRVKLRKKPVHPVRPKWTQYKRLVRKAKEKGYKVNDIDRRRLTVDEVDIPESYLTDAMIVPDVQKRRRKDLIFVDDDASRFNKRKAFAHELGHLHMFLTGEDDDPSDSNNPKIERRADKIGADIMGMSVKEFNSPDVTYNDTRRLRKWNGQHG